MRSMSWSCLVVMLMLMGADVARADTVTYTYVGAGGVSGTSWTLVDTSGYLTVPSGNVIGLVQTATDLIAGGDDLGPLTNISVNPVSGEPAYYGISMGTASFTLAALLIPRADFTTPGTYELAVLSEVRSGLPADQGALNISAAPEPGSAALILSGLALGWMLTRKKNSHRQP